MEEKIVKLRKVTEFNKGLIYQIGREMTQLQSKIMHIHVANNL